MKYYKQIDGDYVAAIGVVKRGGNITKAEYNRLLEIIRNCPEAPEGYQYKLRNADYQWELVELPPEPDPEENI